VVLTTAKGDTMQKMVKGALVLALLGAAVKYGSKHPKWIEYRDSLKRRSNTNKLAAPEAEVIELGRS
jgi:hypothetical protein